MRITPYFLLAAAATVGALEDDPMIHPQMKRTLVETRQTDVEKAFTNLPNLSPSCTSALKSVYGTLPTPPANLLTAVGGGHNPCSITVPASLHSEYTSYSSEIGSWYSHNSHGLSSALSHCPELSRYASLLPVCASSLLSGSHSGTHTGTMATATTTTATTTGGAVRGTGVAFAGLAVAGMVAVAL